jgi:transposase
MKPKFKAGDIIATKYSHLKQMPITISEIYENSKYVVHYVVNGSPAISYWSIEEVDYAYNYQWIFESPLYKALNE